MRREEQRQSANRQRAILLTVVCLAALAAAVAYAAFEIMDMRRVLDEERANLARIEAEYRKYKETKMIVDKADVELLDRLQNGRIFWTRKLAAMALHLPENYWITAFGYKNKTYSVEGYGYISPEQEQLITLDDYLNELRNDSTFCDVFRVTHLNATERDDEYGRKRVSFEYSSRGSKGAYGK
jgi:Tfp pilus assembly protein PilN